MLSSKAMHPPCARFGVMGCHASPTNVIAFDNGTVAAAGLFQKNRSAAAAGVMMLMSTECLVGVTDHVQRSRMIPRFKPSMGVFSIHFTTSCGHPFVCCKASSLICSGSVIYCVVPDLAAATVANTMQHTTPNPTIMKKIHKQALMFSVS